MKKFFLFGPVCLVAILLLSGCFFICLRQEPKQLTVSFETTSPDGRYSPRNVHAVWVEAADGTFIKTLDVWGSSRRAKNLTQWAAVVGDVETAIQARTGATEKAYGAYSSRWDLTDAAGNTVPDGEYIIRFELTSDNANKNNYHRASVPFTKNGKPRTTEPIEIDGYKNIVLDYGFVADAE